MKFNAYDGREIPWCGWERSTEDNFFRKILYTYQHISTGFARIIKLFICYNHIFQLTPRPPQIKEGFQNLMDLYIYLYICIHMHTHTHTYTNIYILYVYIFVYIFVYFRTLKMGYQNLMFFLNKLY